jgi:hypothetical protein
MKKTKVFLLACALTQFSHAAPDTSWINGLAQSSSAAADAASPWDPENAQDQEKLFGKPSDADKNSLKDAQNASNNEQNLKQAGRQYTAELSKDTGTSNAQTSYNLFENSIQSATGEITIDSYGCSFRRTAESDMRYVPGAPAGSQITGHSINLDGVGGCQSEYQDSFGATCSLQAAETTCQVADNTRVIYGDMSAYNVSTDTYENWTADKVNSLPSCGNLALYGKNNNLVVNSGFESNRVSSGGWGYFYGSITGWTGSKIEIQNNHKGRSAAEGSQWVELNSEGYAPTMSQVLNTTPGVSYSVSFLHRPHSYNSENVRLRIGDVDVILGGGNRHRWNRVSVPFTATSNQTTITLSPNRPISGTRGNFVDDIRVVADYCKKVPQITVTPEVGRVELGPMWAGDSQNDVCWIAGLDAKCTIKAPARDESIEAMATKVAQQEGVDQKFLELFGECQATTVAKTHVADLAYTNSKYCTSPLDPSFAACNVQRSPSFRPGTVMLGTDEWSGSARCERLVTELPNWENTCTANVSQVRSECVTVEGVEVCSCSTIQSKYGASLSACGAGQTMVTGAIAGSVPGISTQSVGMCAQISSQNVPPLPPIPVPVDFAICDGGKVAYNHNGSAMCISQSPVKPRATCGPYQEIVNSTLPYGLDQGSIVKSVNVSKVTCPPLDLEECNAAGECYNQALYPYSCDQYKTNGACSLANETCDQEVEHPLGTYCGVAEQEYSCKVSAGVDEEYTKDVMDCGPDGFFECVEDECFEYEDERDDGFSEAMARLAIINGMVDDMFCPDPNDMQTCQIFAGSEKHCSYGNGIGALLYGCCPGHEALLNPFSAIYSAAEMMTKAIDMIYDRVADNLLNPVTGLMMPGNAVAIPALKAQTKATVNIQTAILDAVPLWLVNSCSEDAALIMSHEKNEPDIEVMHYGGRYCTKKISYGLGKICVAKRMNYCVYNTAFAKIVMDAASTQFGISRSKRSSGEFMDCRGISLGEIQQLDWGRVDTKKLAGMMVNTGHMPPQLNYEFGVGNMNAPSTDPTQVPAGWQ